MPRPHFVVAAAVFAVVFVVAAVVVKTSQKKLVNLSNDKSDLDILFSFFSMQKIVKIDQLSFCTLKVLSKEF